MLGECAGEKPASELGDHSYVAYFVEGVDQFHAEVAERGAEVLSQPATEPWGLREFSIRTPDRHRIRFGEPIGALLTAIEAGDSWGASRLRLRKRAS